MEIAEPALNREAVFCERRSAARADEKDDISAGLQQPAAEIAPDRAGAHDENTHIASSFIVADFPSAAMRKPIPSLGGMRRIIMIASGTQRKGPIN